jgi:signal transduction histidine kinase/ActR/RegA family two-component response regulator
MATMMSPTPAHRSVGPLSSVARQGGGGQVKRPSIPAEIQVSRVARRCPNAGGEAMDRVTEILEYCSTAVFLGLAGMSVWRVRRGSAADRWLAGCFASLGSVLLASLLLPDKTPEWVGRATICVLLLFPYLLYRFTSSFGSWRRWLDAVALAALVVVTAVSLFLPSLAETDGPRPAWVQAYLVLFLTYWTGLSTIVVVRLWRSGRGHPTLTRRRMRLMSGAAAGLTVGLLLAAEAPQESTSFELVVQLVVLFTGITFLLGLSPPRTLRLAWRTPEQEAARAAIGELMRAQTATDVARVLLPHVAAIAGASGAALVDPDGHVIDSHGATPKMLHTIDSDDETGGIRPHERIPVNGHGSVVVWTTPYTPFFGKDDLDLVRDHGAVAALALERAELLERERESTAAAELSRGVAERANQAKNEFLSSMSHELRTPLNAILGFGQLLQAASLSEEDRDSVDHIVKAGRHLLDLINEILDLSRIEAGRLALSPEAVGVAELARETVELMRPTAAKRGISIEIEAAPGDVHVSADRQRLKQVLLNLLSNAVKYNREDGGIDVRIAPVDPDRLRLFVVDTGPGIAAGRMERLFEPFERLGAEGTSIEGTGLGLALARRLMEAMGGTIGVDSEPGRGSTFWIELAAAESPIAAFERVNGHAAAPNGDGPPDHTLLLIEDNLSNLALIERILHARPGVALLSAMQGGLGLELARQHRPDLILLDLHLPDIPGHEVLHRLRADPVTRDTPIVVVSADATRGRVQRLMDQGATGYLTKPLDVAELLSVVDDAIRNGRRLGADAES